jgi:hypothetical protein
MFHLLIQLHRVIWSRMNWQRDEDGEGVEMKCPIHVQEVEDKWYHQPSLLELDPTKETRPRHSTSRQQTKEWCCFFLSHENSCIQNRSITVWTPVMISGTSNFDISAHWTMICGYGADWKVSLRFLI